MTSLEKKLESDDVYVVSSNVNEEDSESGQRDTKTTKAGLVLIPQPSEDPNDPLNWSWLKKHAVLLSLIPGCFLTDGVLTYGITLFPQQAVAWRMSVQDVAQSVSGGVFMQGPGGLAAVSLCQRYGRLPVLFWSQMLAMVVSLGAAGSGSYAGYTACRTLQGFFAAAPQVVGLSVIYDMFFFHERARKINIWAFAFLVGPYICPFASSLISEKLGWKDNMWILAGLFGFSSLVIALLGDETLFDRHGGLNPTRDAGVLYRAKLLLGIAGAGSTQNRPSLWSVIKSQGEMIIKPYIFLPTFGFIMPLTMWTIGLVTKSAQILLPPPQAHGYGFTVTHYALMFFAPMIGTILAQIFGHVQNDLIANAYIKKHTGQFVPEVRFWGVYAPWLIGVGGLVLFGETFEHHLSWVGLAFGWGMAAFSVLGTTTAISAYLLDIIPTHASLTAAWILQGRVLGGFTVTYFQAPWIKLDGAAVTFGCQAAIIAAAVVSIVVTQVYGKSWRKRFPVPRPLNAD